jgi:hypothetical protein
VELTTPRHPRTKNNNSGHPAGAPCRRPPLRARLSFAPRPTAEPRVASRGRRVGVCSRSAICDPRATSFELRVAARAAGAGFGCGFSGFRFRPAPRHGPSPCACACRAACCPPRKTRGGKAKSTWHLALAAACCLLLGCWMPPPKTQVPVRVPEPEPSFGAAAAALRTADCGLRSADMVAKHIVGSGAWCLLCGTTQHRCLFIGQAIQAVQITRCRWSAAAVAVAVAVAAGCWLLVDLL